MKFALRIPGNFLYPAITSPWEVRVTGPQTLQFARKAEELGFDYFWDSEHIVQVPEGAAVQGPRFYEALSAAGVVLGATRRIRALTYVGVLPYHNPLVYAKQVATVDVLSEGRLTLGLAAGHLAGEFAALGVAFEERGQRMDEYLRILKVLWTEERPAFRGRFYGFADLIFEPKPVQKPHPPVYIGGDAEPVQPRAALLGDGWIPWLTTPEELPARLERIRELRARAGRSDAFEVLMLLAEFPPEDRLNLRRFRIPKAAGEVLRVLDRLARAGAAGAIVHLPVGTSGLQECLEWVEWFASEIAPQYRPAR